jgi:hypothetical protein|tara:strand:+ start:494 stop:625 length:132 start_codon:yes stop_codon:yes gene_type:complete
MPDKKVALERLHEDYRAIQRKKKVSKEDEAIIELYTTGRGSDA